jgi:very-short-patch-repair endonuclease
MKSKARVISVDIYIPELNLAVEFDASYWHRNSLKKDTEKTRLLRKEGVKVICVREMPLKRITKWDVICEGNTPIKEITNSILKNVLKMRICRRADESNIKIYLKDVELKNQKKAEGYIKRKRCSKNTEKSNSKK